MKIILISCLLISILSCKKGSKETCPLQTYVIECVESYPDMEFGGYNTGTNVYTIQSNCVQDAINEASEMGYDFGRTYKRCFVKNP